MKKRSKIVVFEGPDKVGKETQSKLIAELLRSKGARVTRVEVPCRSATWSHALIYWMLRNDLAKRLPNVFQFVQFLNKLSFQLLDLPDLLRNNDVVVLDRWALSAVVYGDATGVNHAFNTWLYNRLLRPDLTVVFAERSYRRSTRQDDSYERDTELQERVRSGYATWALLHPDDHALVSNDAPVGAVHAAVMDVFASLGVPSVQ